MADPGTAGAGSRPVVAITRSVEANRSLEQRLDAIGFPVLAIPLIEVIAPADAGRALRSALADLASYDWIVVTSANGVRSVVNARADAPWPQEVSVAVVGPATAAAARSAGMPVHLVPEVATASALVDGFPSASGQGTTAGGRGRVLAPLAELAGTTLTDGLAAKGWLVDRVEAYRTVADTGTPWSAEPAPEVVAFFSPSAVDRWVDRFGPWPPTVVCVGPATAARAGAAGFTRIVIADPHTEDGVIAALTGLDAIVG